MLEQPYVRLQVVDGQVLHDDEHFLVDLEHVESLQHALLLYALFQLEPTLVDEQLQLYVRPLVALYIVPQQGVVPRLLDVLLQLVLQQVALALPYELPPLCEPPLLYEPLRHVLLPLCDELLRLYALLRHV